MRPSGILHPGLVELLARAGHGEVIVADEMSSWNPDLEREVADRLSSFDIRRLPHAGFAAELERTALGYVSTSECTAYASIGLVAGVSYYAEAVARFQEAQQHAGERSQ